MSRISHDIPNMICITHGSLPGRDSISLRLEESIDCALMKIILYRGGDYGVVGFRVMNCVGHR